MKDIYKELDRFLQDSMQILMENNEESILLHNAIIDLHNIDKESLYIILKAYEEIKCM